MLYKNMGKALTDAQFANPGSEYRATPFWAWNNELNPKELTWQIEQFQKMGFGGFHMHVRTGLKTPYLSDSFMESIDACVKKAKDTQMLAWLYDEDRWPSGAAGGIVTKNHQYRSKYLLLTRKAYGSTTLSGANDSSARANRAENGTLLATFDIVLNEDGSLQSYTPIAADSCPKGFLLYAYEETAVDSTWYNNQAYLDTLNPAAVKEFIQVTHERYKQCQGAEFGKTIPAIFTDEPQFVHKATLSFAHQDKDVVLPWTGDILDTYRAAYAGEDLLAALPELLWELPQGQDPSLARYHYHDHVAERFAAAFADTCGDWCKANGIMLTGHMMEEPTLESQSAALGEAMRSYRSFQLPGIDMLCDQREFTTAKQAQSAARQYGCPGVLSELYGVTNWDFDFRGHKLQGDWQAALGVTVRVPHLSWVSMQGEAKRDYPGTFNYQAPWYEKYGYVENHFARVNTAMTRGKAVVRLGVIHPIESYWLHWGPRDATAGIRSQMDQQFTDLNNWLLTGCLDFDYISESLFPAQCAVDRITATALPVGEMQYETLLLPGLETIRSSTLARVHTFMEKGGRVFCVGRKPAYVDGKPNQDALACLGNAPLLPFDHALILDTLAPLRNVELRGSSGALSTDYIYQMRQEDTAQWLFIAKAVPAFDQDLPKEDLVKITLNGIYLPTVYNTFTGEKQAIPYTHQGGNTILQYCFFDHDSLLLKLEPVASSKSIPAVATSPVQAARTVLRFLDAVPVTLSEPNVLLLDLAQFALDDQPLRPIEELLRLDNILRESLGFAPRGGAIPQPWVQQHTQTPHTLHLCFRFHSLVTITGAALALENADTTTVKLNGSPAQKPKGWYVDKCIGKVALPTITQGDNVLELWLPYGEGTNVEYAYLLGDFGVQVQGIHRTLTAPVQRLVFGDITTQGLPYYGGNITYHLQGNFAGDMRFCASAYRGHLLELAVDKQEPDALIYAPYIVEKTGLSAGVHQLDLHYYGNRINTFGQLHCFSHNHWWWGPDSWRTTENLWCYEYNLWPQGVLKTPEITVTSASC